jgi:hypothetical protein
LDFDFWDLNLTLHGFLKSINSFKIVKGKNR